MPLSIMLQWHLGNVIAKIIEERKMTRVALAQRVGMSAYQIGQIIRKGETRIKTLEKIAKALKVTPAEIYMGTEDANGDQKAQASHESKYDEFHDLLERALSHPDPRVGRTVVRALAVINEEFSPTNGSLPSSNSKREEESAPRRLYSARTGRRLDRRRKIDN